MDQTSAPREAVVVDDYIDPVYTKDNRHLPKKFAVLKSVMSEEDRSHLIEFVLEKIPQESKNEVSQSHTLIYRTDEWDKFGVINRLQEVAKSHIRDTYYLVGAAEPRKFLLLRTDPWQSYEEVYDPSYINNREILYTAVVTLVSDGIFVPGETIYTSNGEGFVPEPLSMVIHRNERYNNWSISKLAGGTRLDLIMVFREVNMEISYEYEIEMSAEDPDLEY